MQERKTSRNNRKADSFKQNHELPQIPDKLYFPIGEVSLLCELKPHVLRYWEQEFPNLRPSKRRGNRRYYQRKDVMIIREIRDLLYNKGFTIEGARAQLAGGKRKQFDSDAWNFRKQTAITELEKVLEDLG